MPHFYFQFVLYTSYRPSEPFSVILWLSVYPIATLAVYCSICLHGIIPLGVKPSFAPPYSVAL